VLSFQILRGVAAGGFVLVSEITDRVFFAQFSIPRLCQKSVAQNCGPYNLGKSYLSVGKTRTGRLPAIKPLALLYHKLSNPNSPRLENRKPAVKIFAVV